jgi:hypothetical protein
MPWISTNIAAAIGGVSGPAATAVAGVNAALGKLDQQLTANVGKATAVLDAVSAGASLLKQMEAAGLYTIFLEPVKGSWSSRLSGAANAPPNTGFCCGSASIGLYPDLASAAAALGKLKDALEKPMAAAADFIDKLDLDDFIPEEEPEDLVEKDLTALKGKTIDAKFKKSSDTWVSATIGDLFPGAALSAASGLNSAVKQGKALIREKNSLSAIKSFTTKGVSAVTSMLNGMSATGVYTIVLEPAAGGYLSRLQSEAGAPPSSTDMYSTGMVTIATGPDILSLAGKFDTLNKLLKG